MGYYRRRERGGRHLCVFFAREKMTRAGRISCVCEPKVHTRPSAEREINKKMASSSSFFFFCFLSFLEDIRNGFFNFWGLWKIIGNRKKKLWWLGRRRRKRSLPDTERQQRLDREKEKTWPQNSVKKGEKSNDTNPKEEEYYYYMAHCVYRWVQSPDPLHGKKNVKTSGLKKKKKKQMTGRTSSWIFVCSVPKYVPCFSFFKKEIIMIPEAEIFHVRRVLCVVYIRCDEPRQT